MRRMSSRMRQRTTTWIALWALVLGALLPWASQVAQAGQVPAERAGWVEICTTSGTFWLHAQTQEVSRTAPPEGSSASHADCPWCLSQGTASALPTQPAASLPVPLLALQRWAVQRPGVAAHAHWRPDRSRAPPTVALS